MVCLGVKTCYHCHGIFSFLEIKSTHQQLIEVGFLAFAEHCQGEDVSQDAEGSNSDQKNTLNPEAGRLVLCTERSNHSKSLSNICLNTFPLEFCYSALSDAVQILKKVQSKTFLQVTVNDRIDLIV